MLVLAALVGAATTAGGVEPSITSLLPDDLLEQYRTDRACQDGPGYVKMLKSLQVELLRAESSKYMQRSDAPEAGRLAARDFDRAAQAAVARGCPDVARSWWAEILSSFTDPEYAAERQRAEASIAALEKTQPPSQRLDQP